MSYLSRITFPHFNEDYGPQTHEDCKEDRGSVIKEIFGLCHPTRILQRPDITELITDGTHGLILHGTSTNILGWSVSGQSATIVV